MTISGQRDDAVDQNMRIETAYFILVSYLANVNNIPSSRRAEQNRDRMSLASDIKVSIDARDYQRQWQLLCK